MNRGQGGWKPSYGGKVRAPHFFRNNMIQENTVLNNFSSIGLINYGFNSD